jgi:hypothetical protein
VGTYRRFNASYADPNGASNIRYVYLSINRFNPAKRLEALYDAQTNLLYLYADDGVTLLGGFAIGSSHVISNSHASIDCATTTVGFAGNTLIMTGASRPLAPSPAPTRSTAGPSTGQKLRMQQYAFLR